MNKLQIVIALVSLVLTSGAASASKVEVEMSLSCTVKDNLVMLAQEGRPQRYTHFTDSFVVSDTLNFSIKIRSFTDSPDESIVLQLKDNARNKSVISVFSTINEKNIRNLPAMDAVSAGEFHDSFLMTTDTIYLDGSEGNSHLHLKRYYRGDWQGMFINLSDGDAQVTMIDCRTEGQNTMDHIIARLISRSKNWNE